MFQDRETFVPGKITEPTTITFTKEDLAHGYESGMDCPVYHAMKRAGFPVVIVGGWSLGSNYWLDKDGHVHGLSRELVDVLLFLNKTDYPPLLGSRRKLCGKTFVVSA